MIKTPATLEQYVDACNYPGVLNEAAVETALQEYLLALGVKKNVRRLPRGWTLDEHPAIARNVDFIIGQLRVASVAHVASDASVARDASDARVAHVASVARHRLAAWAIMGAGYWGYWDLSWVSPTALGARQLKKMSVSKWADPLFHAYVAGCWTIYWTDDTLYWIAKPTMHFESTENENRRLHRQDGPAFVSDIEDLHFWRGTLIPSEWIEHKSSLDAKTALTWPNMEQRRIACSEIVGWNKILTELEATVIDADGDPQIGTLVEVTLPDLPQRAKFLRVQCGTGRSFVVGIPPHINSALSAQAWMQGVELRDFRKPEIRT